jgi:hypothetical protein
MTEDDPIPTSELPPQIRRAIARTIRHAVIPAFVVLGVAMVVTAFLVWRIFAQLDYNQCEGKVDASTRSNQVFTAIFDAFPDGPEVDHLQALVDEIRPVRDLEEVCGGRPWP